MLTEFPLSDSIALTESAAWEKFLFPSLKRERYFQSLKREGYEKDGFKAVKIQMTLEEIQSHR